MARLTPSPCAPCYGAESPTIAGMSSSISSLLVHRARVVCCHNAIMSHVGLSDIFCELKPTLMPGLLSIAGPRPGLSWLMRLLAIIARYVHVPSAAFNVAGARTKVLQQLGGKQSGSLNYPPCDSLFFCTHMHTSTLEPRDSNRQPHEQIELDLLRTMPLNRCFSDLKASGICKLRRVLGALSRHPRGAGYCQGFNFIAAFALMFLEEEQAFW